MKSNETSQDYEKIVKNTLVKMVGLDDSNISIAHENGQLQVKISGQFSNSYIEYMQNLLKDTSFSRDYGNNHSMTRDNGRSGSFDTHYTLKVPDTLDGATNLQKQVEKNIANGLADTIVRRLGDLENPQRKRILDSAMEQVTVRLALREKNIQA